MEIFFEGGLCWKAQGTDSFSRNRILHIEKRVCPHLILTDHRILSRLSGSLSVSLPDCLFSVFVDIRPSSTDITVIQPHFAGNSTVQVACSGAVISLQCIKRFDDFTINNPVHLTFDRAIPLDESRIESQVIKPALCHAITH